MPEAQAFGGMRVDDYGIESADGPVAGGPDHHERDRLVLAVGSMADWDTSALGIRPSERIVTAAFGDVTPELLQHLSPYLVVSPLLCGEFDCVDLARTLGALGYRGRYRAIGAGIPNPALVAREVRALVPWLDFDVVTAGTGS